MRILRYLGLGILIEGECCFCVFSSFWGEGEKTKTGAGDHPVVLFHQTPPNLNAVVLKPIKQRTSPIRSHKTHSVLDVHVFSSVPVARPGFCCQGGAGICKSCLNFHFQFSHRREHLTDAQRLKDSRQTLGLKIYDRRSGVQPQDVFTSFEGRQVSSGSLCC